MTLPFKWHQAKNGTIFIAAVRKLIRELFEVFSTAKTFAPSFAYIAAMALPITELVPVTIAVLPVSLILTPLQIINPE
jgi:hypothetical protein